MPNVNPLIKIGIAVTGLPKEKQIERYVSMHSDTRKKSKEVAAQVFYKIGQFFLSIIGQADKQIIKRSTNAYICKLLNGIAKANGQNPSKAQIRQLKKTLKPAMKPLLKALVAINQLPAMWPKATTDALIKDAKAARAAMSKGQFQPALQIFEELAATAPDAKVRFTIQKMIGFFNGIQHKIQQRLA